MEEVVKFLSENPHTVIADMSGNPPKEYNL